MKSAVYNEVALVLLGARSSSAARSNGSSTRSEAFLCDAQGRDNVTDAELALDADGTFLGLRVKTIAARRRLSADRRRPPSSAISARSPASIARPRSMST